MAVTCYYRRMNIKQKWIFAWAVLRLPLLALVTYLFRFQIAEALERTVELWRVMDLAVYSASTASTRILLYLGCVLVLGLGLWLTGKLPVSPSIRYVVSTAGAFAGIVIAFIYLFKTGDALARAGIVTALLALNTMPQEWLSKRVVAGRLLSLVFLAGVGLVEAVVPQAYVIWLAEKFRAGNSIKKWSWLSGVMIAPLFWIFLLVPFDNQRVLTLSERLHANPTVEKFAQGDFNWIELNAEHGLLYAVGRGTNYLLAFDVNDLGKPPRRSQEDIGKTQGFAYNPERQEIYAYKTETRELIYMDALTLETLHTVPVPDLSPGDIWMVWEKHSDSILIASEADVETGTPLILFDRESGNVIATLPLPWVPTNIAVHADKPMLYFNSFKDTYLAAWDMVNHEVAADTTTSPRTDRLIYSPTSSEILVASTLEGLILRYDAETLEYLGSIKTSLGDRTMTHDIKRNLLLVGNFINNKLTVFDLNTFESVETFYLGPWIRTITLDAEQGIAYVSTVRGLFKVRYIHP